MVISRRVRPGREREFERWISRLRVAAARAPGHVSLSLQPPDASHPDEWVTVYRFETVDQLQDWLHSAERLSLIEESRELIEGEPREQFVADMAAAQPVTAVISVRVRPGCQDAYRALQGEVRQALRSFDGFLRSETFDAVPGVQEATVTVFGFDSRAHLDAWLSSDTRRALLARMEPLVVGKRTINVVGGFAGWFPSDQPATAKRWKQGVTVLLAIFPITLLITVLRQWLVPDLPLVAAVLVGNVISVALLTWVLMPSLTRWLAAWLSR